MDFKKIADRYGAYAIAAVVFVALAFIYCRPEFSGKTLQPGDSVNAISAIQEAIRHDPAEGPYGFWNGSVYSGMPNYQIGAGVTDSDKLIGPLNGFFRKGGSSAFWVFIFYFFAFFVLLRSFGVGKWLSIAGSIATALSSYFVVIIAAGHGGKTMSIAFITLVLAGFYLIFRRKYVAGAVLTMLFTAVGYTPHPQMSYYMFMMIGLLYIFEFVQHARERRWKDLGIGTAVFAACVLIGLGTGAPGFLANMEYAEQTMRGGHSDLTSPEDSGEEAPSKGLNLDYATQWSYGIDESMTFIIPGFMGGSSNTHLDSKSLLYKELTSNGVSSRNARDFCANVPLYWGDQPFTAGNVYMGAIVCFLFILGLMLVKGSYKWGLLACTLFSVALAWGFHFMPLTELFFKYFPMYDKFRAVSSILVVAEVAMPLLGFLGLKEIFEGKVEKKALLRSLYIAAGVTGGICLFFALFGKYMFSFTSLYDARWAGGMPSWAYDAIIAQRAALMTSDSWRSLGFIAAAAAVLWLMTAGKLRKGIAVAALGVLILVDMWPVDRRYFSERDFITPQSAGDTFAMQPWEKAILQDDDPHFRVFNLASGAFNESRTSYYLKSIGGYHAAKLRRYQDLIDEHLSKMHWPVIGMLNAKYVVVQGEDGALTPQLNPYALGNVWWVGKIYVADNANDESDALNLIDVSCEAVIDKSFAGYVDNLEPGIAEDASVRLVKYQPRYIDYECSSSQPGTLVFSEIYYPYGWKASIDGVPAEHYRANYTLRALNVPAGQHSIHFEFDPDSVRLGNVIAMVCIILMYLLIVVAITIGIRQLKTQH